MIRLNEEKNKEKCKKKNSKTIRFTVAGSVIEV